MTDRIPASHAEHDPLLVAALAAGDLEPAERELAEALASRCSDCALLAADLRAITAASAALPARTRPRDFSLRAEDAARLRRRAWRGWKGCRMLCGRHASGRWWPCATAARSVTIMLA